MNFSNHCSGCGTRIDTPMERDVIKHKDGTVTKGPLHLPRVFCNRVCESDYEKKSRMVDNKPLTAIKKGISTAELTQRMSKSPWNRNFGGQYVPEEQIVKQEVPI